MFLDPRTKGMIIRSNMKDEVKNALLTEMLYHRAEIQAKIEPEKQFTEDSAKKKKESIVC